MTRRQSDGNDGDSNGGGGNVGNDGNGDGKCDRNTMAMEGATAIATAGMEKLHYHVLLFYGKMEFTPPKDSIEAR